MMLGQTMSSFSRKKGYLIDFGKVNAIASSSAKKYKRHYDHIAPEVLDGNPPTPASDVFFN